MKKYFLTLAIFLLAISLKAQVAIAPLVVYINPATRFGEYELINNNIYDSEIEISLKFAYPMTDSLGKVKFKFEDSTESQWTLNPYVKIFPKKFTLKPKGQQKVKFLMALPPDAPDGMYWSRIITKTTPKVKAIDSVTDAQGARASIVIVTHFANLIVYQKGKIDTRLALDGTDYYQDSTDVNLLFKLHQFGNSPAWSRLDITIYDEAGNEAMTVKDVVAVYSDIVKKVPIKLAGLKPGKYVAEYSFSSDRTDIPKEKHTPFSPINGKMEFTTKSD